MKYETAHDSEWFAPKHKGFKHMCCGCALTHIVDFKIKDGDVYMRWRQDKRATAAARRPFKFKGDKDEA